MLDLTPYLFAKYHLSDTSLFTSSAVSETEVYIADTFKLVDSMVIHSVGTQVQMLSANVNNHGLDPSTPLDQQTYYKNMSGEYGTWEIPMDLYSLDTQTTIPLDKSILDDHPLTKTELLLKSDLYYALVNKYPLKELLIDGILSPIDLSKSTEARDGEILSYDRSLVQSNELTLMEDIQDWVYLYFKRHVNWSYLHSDNLYAACVLSILYGQLVPTILNYRTSRCKTPEAHSFHVHQYLKSNGLDDHDLGILSLRQQLWFYRNITDVKKHRGHQRVFKDLIKVMTEHTSLSIGGYSTALHHQPPTVPALFTRRDILTSVTTGTVAVDIFKSIEDKIAVGNSNTTLTQYEDTIDQASVVTTRIKSLSISGDEEESPVIARAEFMLSMWAYMSQEGSYKGNIPVVIDPSKPAISLTVKDAFTYSSLLASAIQGKLLASTPCSIYLPIVQQLDSVLSPVSNTDLDNIQLLNLYIVPKQSVEQPVNFIGHVTDLYTGYTRLSKLVASTEDSHLRTALTAEQNVVYNSIEEYPLSSGGYLVSEWLASKDLIMPPDHDTQTALFKQIVQAGIGIDMDKYKDGRANAVASLLTKLLSYTINFVSTDDMTINMTTGHTGIVSIGSTSITTPPPIDPPCGHRWWRIVYNMEPPVIGPSYRIRIPCYSNT